MATRLILDLKGVLNSKKELSEWETDELVMTQGKSAFDFLKGAVISYAVIWRVLRASPTVLRVSLSTMIGVVGGKWYGGRSFDAGIDRLLGLQGTRIQTELASLILREYKDDESLLMLVRKHFYSEQVFGDSNPDVPLFRWRPRNTYVDSVTSQKPSLPDRVEGRPKSHQLKPTTGNSETTKSNYSGNNGLPEKQNTQAENRDWDLFVDPLDSIFGYSENSKETEPMGQSEPAELHSRRRARAVKRAHRRQRYNDASLS